MPLALIGLLVYLRAGVPEYNMYCTAPESNLQTVQTSLQTESSDKCNFIQ